MMDAEPSPVRRYSVAAVVAIAALLLEMAISPWTAATPFKFFFGAVAAAAWYGGLGPGVLATVLGAFFAGYVVIPPRFTPILNAEQVAALAVFVVVSLFVSWSSGRLNAERQRASAARAAAEADRRRATFLAEASAILASSLDYETRLESLARLAVPTLADWCVVDLLGEDGLIHRLAIAHADPAKEEPARRLKERYPTLPPDAEHTITRVLREGRPWFDAAVGADRFVGEARDADHLELLRALGFASEMVVPLVARGRALGTITLAFGREGGRRHTPDDLAAAEELAGRAALAIDNARLYAEAERERQRQAFLAEAGRLLAGTLDEAAVLGELARLAVPRLADWSVAYLADDAGGLRRLAVAGPDPETTARVAAGMGPAVMTPAAADPLARALRTGEVVLVEQVTPTMVAAAARDGAHLDAMRTIDLRSHLVAPLVAGGRTLGALSLAMSGSGRRYGPADAALATDVAGRAALALAHARLYAAERRARAAAEAAEARYRALFAGVAEAILVSDAGGRTIDANAAMAHLSGYSREELLHLATDALAASGRAWEHPEIDRVGPGETWRGELELRRKDGTTVPVEAAATRLELPTGAVSIRAMRDIGERRALERLRQEYVATLGHDLKAPLTGIKAAAQLMQRRGEYRERSVSLIVGEVDRLTRLVDDLLDAARLEAGRLEVRRAPVDLVELARVAAERAQAMTEVHQVRVEAPERPVAGSWDRDRLTQVLGNLLSNAVKYAPDGGEIIIVVDGDDTEARVTVRDRGTGIPAEALPRLFDRFYRAREAGERGAEGLGLGLYISKGLVEAHGGRLWAESAVGRGSAFTVALPYDQPDEDDASKRASPPGGEDAPSDADQD